MTITNLLNCGLRITDCGISYLKQVKIKNTFAFCLLPLRFSTFAFWLLPFASFSQTDSSKVLNEVIISASRSEEKLMQAPMTVEKISAKQLQNAPSIEILSSLSKLKGIDVSQTSWFVSSLSTRGFNSAKSERILQLSDGVDFMSPTSSLYGGNWMGVSDLDVESIDVLYGANSALYGSGAFNGVVMMNSKNPFKHQGTTLSFRTGNRNLLDFQVRYAKVWGNFALKLNANYAEADEFLSDNNNAIRKLSINGITGFDGSNNATGSNLGWNAVTRYGDAGSTVTNPDFTKWNNNNPYRIYAQGYTEKEIAWANSPQDIFGLLAPNNLKAGHLRLNPSLHYKISDKVLAIYEYRYSIGNGIFQSTDRFHWRNMKYDLHKIELKNDSWFLRAYTVFDYGGDAYNFGAIGSGLQNGRIGTNLPTFATNYFNLWNQVFAAARGNGLAGGTLAGVWQPNFNGGDATNYTLNQAISGNQSIEQAQALATQLAQQVQIPVGSPLFNQIREKVANGIGNVNLNGANVKGAGFDIDSRYVDFSGQKSWKISPQTNVLLGAAHRIYQLKSNGTIFQDGAVTPLGTDARTAISNYETGAYAQIKQSLLNEKLQLSAVGRFDNFKNFGSRFSPRFSAVYSPSPAHNFRVNVANAYRSPAQLDQYIYLDYGSILLIGNSEKQGFKGFAGSNATTAQVSYGQLKPEQMTSWEVGYKGMIAKNLLFDASYYRSQYNNFIGIVRLYGREDGQQPSAADFAKPATDRTRARFLQIWANYDKPVNTQGFMASLEWTASKKIQPYFNYTWSQIGDVKGLIAGFNTPSHKFNVGFNGTNKQIIYSANYRHSSKYTYFMPMDEGEIDAFGTLDAQIGYQVPKLKTIFKLGGTNLSNSNAVYVYGSAPISRVIYVGAVVNVN